MLFSDLKQKEVINVADGKSLGFIGDLDIDECNGIVRAIIVPGPGRLFGVFGRECEYVIEWPQIVKIGPDIVLVNVCDTHCCRKL